MNRWNEEDFLEIVIPLLREKGRVIPCPQTEALMAAEEDAPQSINAAVDLHTSLCPACADLNQRLLRFNDGHLQGTREWEGAEKRLDHWFNSSFVTDAAVDSHLDIEESAWSHWWREVVRVLYGRQMRWALAAVCVVALAIGSFVVGRVSAPPKLIATLVSPNGTTQQSRYSAEDATSPQPDAPTAQGRATKAADTRTLRKPRRPENIQSGERPAIDEKDESAVATLAAPPATNEAQVPLPTPAEQGAVVAPASKPRVAPNGDVLPGTRSYPNSRALALRPPPNSPSVDLHRAPNFYPGAGLSAFSPRPASHPQATDGNDRLAIPTPPVIRLESGTRVWITLKSVQARPDGSSDFRGIVLLPITQSDTILVARNTPVFGIMTPKNGKRSVQILEFLPPGAHYRLESAGGEANVRPLGAGEAVQFDAGRVLETWMESTSTYRKLAE